MVTCRPCAEGTYALADVLVSTDCIDVPNDKRDRNGCSHVNFNTGVLHFRPTEASKQFLQTWKTKAGVVGRWSVSFFLTIPTTTTARLPRGVSRQTLLQAASPTPPTSDPVCFFKNKHHRHVCVCVCICVHLGEAHNLLS